MAKLFPAMDLDAEATHICVKPAAGAVFIRLRREFSGRVKRRMFVELNLAEAMQLERDLKDVILTAMTPA